MYNASVITVSALFIYPIKSCRGISVQGFRLDEFGPYLDRRFMVVDDKGAGLTQRVEPRLALVEVTLQPTALTLKAPGMRPLKLRLSQHDDGTLVPVSVWEYRGSAFDEGSDASEWFSEFLSRPCRLVRLAPVEPRRVDPKYVPDEVYVGFSDGFPELLLSEASIDDLSKRAQQTFEVERFRPNILVTGNAAPYEEDQWTSIRIGEIPFDLVKPCARCVIVTTDQATAERNAEPLATLATYRRQGNGVLFGQNCVHRALGSVRVGDVVSVVATR
ncbi:MAG TPA: MOSC N-terminal beta barrel domain-containing protein [Polyangiales bacterium]|nr:MOSC N-terminal beta barrel domain-containing protein [Polyangiales bacterium]